MNAVAVRVLVVEDDPSIRNLLTEVLRHYGYAPQQAPDGQEALDLFAAEPADIVITDVRMPGMDGLEVLSRIKRERPETSVVVMTGYGSEEIAIQAMRCGASNYFKKPVNVSEFAYAVGVLADMVRSRRVRRFNPHLIVREERELRLGTGIEVIYPVIRELTETASALRFDVESVRIGLLEILTNAIEHGSLGISGAEKREHLRRGTLKELYASRAASPPWRDREVMVRYELTPSSLSYTVSDQGDGFNWRALPDPADPNLLMAECGRGIIVTRLCMDEVEFSERGNQVRIAKRSRPESPSA